MNKGAYVFSQIMGLISHKKFQTIVNQHYGDYKVKDFTCWKQYLCMAFGQMTHRESLSDTMLCLKANAGKLYHLGIGNPVSVSTISRANETRSYKIYETLAVQLIREAKDLYIDEKEKDVWLHGNVFAIDATTIDLSVTAFLWATFRTTKSGIKLHTQLDLSTAIPEFILVTPASVHDVNILDMIRFEANSFYIMDRGYIDYKRLFKIHESGAYFVTRAKDNMSYRRVYSHEKESGSGVIYDQSVKLNNHYASQDYPLKIRRIKNKDADSGKTLVFLTNNFQIKATDIAQLYRNRWKIELFFKWIKQHLRIKAFYGTSESAVKTQIWIAVSVYVLVAIVRKRLAIKSSLYSFLQILSLTLFEKMPILRAFEDIESQDLAAESPKQLILFDF